MIAGVPTLQTLTSGTSLVLYEKLLPGRYCKAVPIIKVLPDNHAEYADGFRREEELGGYDPQGHFNCRVKEGLFINFYV